MVAEMNGLFVISGGPGTGKSTLIGALRNAGMPCFEEVSRQIIIESNTCGSDLLPWCNLPLFADECYRRMMLQLDEVRTKELCFFDRGIPDIIAYLRNGKVPIPEHLYADGRGYAKLVFMAPPWKEIFVNDSERPQSFEECQRLHNLLTEVYVELGYQVIMLPKVSVEQRVHFVFNSVLDFYARMLERKD